MEPLYIFMDLEASHGNNYFGDVIEIAAQVDPRVLEEEIFSSLVNTKQNLSYFGKCTFFTQPAFIDILFLFRLV